MIEMHNRKSGTSTVFVWVWLLEQSSLPVGEGNGNPLQCSCLENPRDGGASWAAVYGVAQSRTRLKRLSSSSSSSSSNWRMTLVTSDGGLRKASLRG